MTLLRECAFLGFPNMICFSYFQSPIPPHAPAVNKMVDDLRSDCFAFFVFIIIIFLDNCGLGFVCCDFLSIGFQKCSHLSLIPTAPFCLHFVQTFAAFAKSFTRSRDHDIDFVAVAVPLVQLYPHHGCRS